MSRLKFYRLLKYLCAIILCGLLFIAYTQNEKIDNSSNINNFTLQTAANATGQVSLFDLQGKVVLLYFGYTHCPDICPTTLANMASAFAMLSKDEMKHIQGLFVSVDPKRDDVQHLAEYTAYFHPAIIGATGSNAQLKKAAKPYQAWFKQGKVTDDDYQVLHSDHLFLLNKNGKLIDIMSHNTQAKDIVIAIRAILSTK
ncbi:MAG: SCO family protein [Mariprofundales bacterium]